MEIPPDVEVVDVAPRAAPRADMVEVGGAKSSELRPRYDQIPACALRRIAERFGRGSLKFDDPEESKRMYGRMNWQGGDDEYFRERFNHIIYHLMLWKEGDKSDDHLAAAAWGCIVQMWREEQPR